MKIKQMIGLLAAAAVWCEATAASRIVPAVRYHREGQVVSRTDFDLQNPTKTDANGCQWQLTVDQQPVPGDASAQDYTFTWELKSGEAQDVSFAVDFQFDGWTPDNYVFVPAIVYDGNRFDVKNIGYPPFWYEPSEWRLDMPTTTTVQPTLGKKDAAPSRIELTSGNASTPLMAFFSARDRRAWMVQTNQGNQLGDYGLSLAENDDR